MGYDDPAEIRWRDVFRTGLRLWKPRWRDMALLSLILTAPLSILGAATRSVAALSLSLLLADLFVLWPLANICLVRMCWLSSAGEEERIVSTFRSQRPSWGSAIIAVILGVLILAGILAVASIPFGALVSIVDATRGRHPLLAGVASFVLAAITVIAVLAKLFAVPQGIVFEQLSGKRAVGRSWSLTRGKSFWQALGIVAVTSTVSVATGIAIVRLVHWVLGGTNVPSMVFGATAGAILASITRPLSVAILTVLYARQRSREPAISVPLVPPVDTSRFRRRKGRRPNVEGQR
jgi:hypothetical protein